MTEENYFCVYTSEMFMWKKIGFASSSHESPLVHRSKYDVNFMYPEGLEPLC